MTDISEQLPLGILHSFCLPQNWTRNEFLKTPFNWGDHTYASDGRIAIVVPKRTDADYPTNDNGIHIDQYGKYKFGVHYAPLPLVPDMVMDICEMCNGIGTSPYNPYSRCEDCEGEPYSEKQIAIKVGTRYLSSIYIRKIAMRLEGVVIMRNGDAYSPARFEFKGGYGFLMPLRIHNPV